jgi:hypothetical protein
LFRLASVVFKTLDSSSIAEITILVDPYILEIYKTVALSIDLALRSYRQYLCDKDMTHTKYIAVYRDHRIILCLRYY